jgi:hypothetical protein
MYSMESGPKGIGKLHKDIVIVTQVYEVRVERWLAW